MSSGYFDWETAYGQYHNRFPGYKKQPVIGITGSRGKTTAKEWLYQALSDD